VLYSVCPQINTLQSFCKIPNPQIISVQIQSVNIMINIRMNERFDFSSTRIIMEKPLIFCTYPECAVMGGTKLPHPFSHFVWFFLGIDFIKVGILPGVIIHTPKISPYPHSAFTVFENRIDGIVRDWIGITVDVLQVDDFCRVQIIDIKSRFGSYP